MENASRALTIAGTILISLIVISALILMFRELRGNKVQEADIQRIEQTEKFNKSYESYKKTLYGSELLSLANKMKDYNTRVAGKDGYEEMELEVTINGVGKKDIDYFTDIIDEESKLMNTYKSAGNLEALYETNNKDTEAAKYQRNQILKKINKTEDELGNLNKDYETYQKYSGLKNKKFKSIEPQYSENGRIKKMTYKEE